MGETLWAPAIAVLASGFGVGGALALVLHLRGRSRLQAAGGGTRAAPPSASRSATARGSSGPGCGSVATDAPRSEGPLGPGDVPSELDHLDDLRSRKAQLLEQLRDLQDTESAPAEERAELEQQAALVMRELAEAEAGKATEGAQESARGAEMRGAIKGVAVVAVLALIGLALWQGVRPREEGMGITGGDQVPGASGGGATPGDEHPAEGQGAPIRPADTPRLQQARELVQANPESLEAQVELGYALAEAAGWIDLYKTTQAILARDPDNPDALIQQAMLRYAMRQPKQADALIDQVLAREPENLRALEVGGRIALRAESWSRAARLLAQAVEKLGSGEREAQGRAELEKLVQLARSRAKSGDAPGPAGGSAAATQARSSAPAAAAPASSGADAPAAAGSAGTVAGTITLSAGLAVPSGGALYVMARPAGVTAGPPLAAVRLPISAFPVAFRLDRSNAMMGGELPRSLSLSARLDADGDVATKQPQDLAGQAPAPVQLGAAGVEIVLRPVGS